MKVLNDICLELHVPDMGKAISFYSTLGFEVVWNHGEQLQLMVMRRGSSLLKFYGGSDRIFEQSYFKRFPHNTPHGYGVEIIIPVENIEELFNLIQETNPDNIISALQVRFTKQEFRLVDPFGFYLRIVEDYDWINDWGGYK